MSDWGDAISAAGSAIQNVSNAFAGKLNFKDNLKLMHESWKYNDWVRTEQNGFNAKQAWLARQFVDQQRIAQNVYSEAMYNKYSSPEAMVRQLQAAGLNPRLAMGSQNAGSISASSGSSGSGPAASGSAIAGAAPPYIQDLNYQTNGFLNVANSLKALAEAKNLGVDTKFAEESLQDRLKQVKLSNTAQELANSINEVVYRYLPEKERRNIELMIQQFSKGELEMEEIRKNLYYLEQRGLLAKKEVETFDERFEKEMANTEADTQNKKDQHELFPLTKSDILAGIGLKQASAFQARAAGRLSDSITALNDIDYQIKNFKGSQSFFNPEWRRLSNYCKTQLETFADNLEILGYEVVCKKNESKASGYDVIIRRANASEAKNRAYISSVDAEVRDRENKLYPNSQTLGDGSIGTVAKLLEAVVYYRDKLNLYDLCNDLFHFTD